MTIEVEVETPSCTYIQLEQWLELDRSDIRLMWTFDTPGQSGPDFRRTTWSYCPRRPLPCFRFCLLRSNCLEGSSYFCVNSGTVARNPPTAKGQCPRTKSTIEPNTH